MRELSGVPFIRSLISFTKAPLSWPSPVQFSHSVVSNSLRPYGLQQARPPCPSPTPGVYSNSCPLSWWCHPTISSSVIPFSSCLQSLAVSGSFQMSQFFASSGQSIGVSALASVLPMNTQDWSHLEWTGWMSLQCKGLSRVFSNTTVQKHQFFSAQISSQSNSQSIHDHWSICLLIILFYYALLLPFLLRMSALNLNAVFMSMLSVFFPRLFSYFMSHSFCFCCYFYNLKFIYCVFRCGYDFINSVWNLLNFWFFSQ